MMKKTSSLGVPCLKSMSPALKRIALNRGAAADTN